MCYLQRSEVQDGWAELCSFGDFGGELVSLLFAASVGHLLSSAPSLKSAAQYLQTNLYLCLTGSPAFSVSLNLSLVSPSLPYKNPCNYTDNLPILLSLTQLLLQSLFCQVSQHTHQPVDENADNSGRTLSCLLPLALL